jgi:hypothetical protein
MLDGRRHQADKRDVAEVRYDVQVDELTIPIARPAGGGREPGSPPATA